MRFALLAPDPEILALARIATHSPGHALFATYAAQSDRDPLTDQPIFNRVEANEIGQWERLLHAPECDAVLMGIAGSPELRGEQLRKLVQSQMPLVVCHPACDMLTGFELQMIQRDSNALVVPYFAGLMDRSIVRLGRLIASGSPLGSLRQIVLERQVADSAPEDVTRAFARDALLFRRLVGRIDRISALGAMPYPSDDWSNLSVHMTSFAGVILRWSAIPVQFDRGTSVPQVAALTVNGSQRTLILRQASDSAEWNYDPPLRELAGEDALGSQISPAWPLDMLSNPENKPAIDELWDDACRSVELAESIEASYRRGKTIEMYHEEHTEEETFKGMMAAGGCLALMITLLLLPILLFIESLEIPLLNDPMWDQGILRLFHYSNWPYYLFAALAIFLSLQLLLALFSKDRPADPPRKAP